VIVVSGPSGAGKGTLIRAVQVYFPGLEVARSVTSRAPRAGEHDGVEYYFVSNEEFDRRIADGDLLEHVEFAGNRYGTLVSEVQRLQAQGSHVILELELQGALLVDSSDMDSVLVFVEPPDFAELERRLRARASDSDEEIARRMDVARSQVDAKRHFQYVVVNDDQDRAVAELHDILQRELLPVPARHD
jgi:guanylate kinase